MAQSRLSDPRMPGEAWTVPSSPMRLGLPLVSLLAIGALALVGPWGIAAWHENAALLSERQAERTALRAELAALENRVELLGPEAADPDLVGELIRPNLGVLHPDEVVITLEDE